MVVILVAKTVLHVNEKASVADRHGRNWPCSAIATKFALSLIYFITIASLILGRQAISGKEGFMTN